MQSIIVTHGHMHVGDARLALWVRYSASPSFFAVALDEAFVTEISQKARKPPITEMIPRFGPRSPCKTQ